MPAGVHHAVTFRRATWAWDVQESVTRGPGAAAGPAARMEDGLASHTSRVVRLTWWLEVPRELERKVTGHLRARSGTGLVPLSLTFN